MVPGVEDWLASASKKGIVSLTLKQSHILQVWNFIRFSEQEVATKFFRTLSSHGKRPDPAAKAALHRSRVRSAVMTPSQKQREEKNARSAFKHLER